ncbi:MAG: GNAT family protein [Sediminibacterium sp.]
MKAPVLHTERLILKPINLSYCTQQYVDWMNDPDVNTYLDSGGNYTIDELKKYLSPLEEHPILFWAITLKESGKHIGNVKIDPIKTKSGLGEYGILMGDKNEWNKGYAQEASQAAIDYCFNELHLRKITLGVVEDNVPAVNLYYKMGFVQEGLYKYHGKYNGKYCHALRMAVFNKAFQYADNK